MTDNDKQVKDQKNFKNPKTKEIDEGVENLQKNVKSGITTAGEYLKGAFEFAKYKLNDALEKLPDKKKEDKKDNINHSQADELAKFKDLLDKNVITPEEYEAKKEQILSSMKK